MQTWKIMTPRGWCGPEYQASTSEEAIQLATYGGYDVIDVMDDILVVADEEPAPLCERCGEPGTSGLQFWNLEILCDICRELDRVERSRFFWMPFQ